MPLRELPATSIDESALLADAQDEYLIFYSSRDDDGKMWCPDCRRVEELVQRVFGPPQSDAPRGLIIYVGNKTEWKSPSHPLRNGSLKITSIPTILKLGTDARLVDEEIDEGLATLVQG